MAGATRAERLEWYAALRDKGMRPPDAAREVGITSYSNAKRYERWYRAQRGLAPPGPGAWP